MDISKFDPELGKTVNTLVEDINKLRDILVEAWQSAFKDLAETLELLAESIEDIVQVKPKPKLRPVKSMYHSGRVIDQRAIIYSMCPARYR